MRCHHILGVTLTTLLPLIAGAQQPTTLPTDQPTTHPHLHAAAAGYESGFFIREGVFALRIRSRVQARYTAEVLDGEQDKNAWSIPRARLALRGHAFSPRLRYYFQLDFSKGSAELKDFFLTYQAIPSWLHLQIGQWKVPFSRQHITSSSKLEFVDRAITHDAMRAARDIGIAIHNGYTSSPRFEYVLGLFNGKDTKGVITGPVQVDPTTGEGELIAGKASNVPQHLDPSVVLRVAYNHAGIKGYEEADFAGGPLRFSLGGGLLVNFDADGDDASAVRSQLDFALKLHGFAAHGGAFLSTTQSGDAFGDQSLASVGFRVQVGFLMAQRVQLSARYAHVAPDGADNDQHEALAGVTVYFYKHGLKWQSDGGALLSEVGPNQTKTDVVVRSQLQFAF
ncbi:MAG: hypothetical protein JRH20_02195 [Deltaproteobacteria bacterium]|nr:hypothetical protein [Deltaproteobacteria bacterium]